MRDVPPPKSLGKHVIPGVLATLMEDHRLQTICVRPWAQGPYSLVATCEVNGVNPREYIAYEELLPGYWTRARNTS